MRTGSLHASTKLKEAAGIGDGLPNNIPQQLPGKFGVTFPETFGKLPSKHQVRWWITLDTAYYAILEFCSLHIL